MAIVTLGLVGAALAQTGPSYELSECALNAGGHPFGGESLHSAGYRMSLDALGDAVAAPVLKSRAYSMDAGFARSYPPPAEVRGLAALPDKRTFVWEPDSSVGAYGVYRGDVGTMPGYHGTCRLADLPLQTAALDEIPDPGQGFFYLVTATSRLDEEGTKGLDSAGAERGNLLPCP